MKETGKPEQKKKGKSKRRNKTKDVSRKLESLKKDIEEKRSENTLKRSERTTDSEDETNIQIKKPKNTEKGEVSSNDTETYEEMDMESRGRIIRR